MSVRPKFIFILCAIVFFGFILRFTSLDQMPPSLNWDEVSHGYNAYSILKTGKDEWGQLPLSNFRSYGDYPLPVNLYLTLPSIAIFGLNEFSIRLPHALLGTATILVAAFTVLGLGLGRKVALLVALFVAIDPWTFFPSRAVFQSNVGLFFFTAGVACFFYRQKYLWLLPLSALLFGVSAYSYHNFRIVAPLFVFFLIFLYRGELASWLKKRKTHLISSALLLFVFFLPLIPILLSSEGRARSQWVFLIDQGAINRINEGRVTSPLPDFAKPLLFNKATYFIIEFSKNYAGYFSPQFLFFDGGTQYQFSVPGKGVLYPVNLPFFYGGLLIILWSALRRKREYLLILFWLLLGFIPAAITQGGYQVIRSTTVLPVPQILTAVGLVVAWEWLRNIKYQISNIKYILILAYVIGLLFFIENYAIDYIGRYRTNYSWGWQYGYREAVQFIKENYNDYDRIIMTKKYGEPHEFILFYWPWDPEKYRSDPNLIRFYQSNWYWVDRFDKFHFVNDWQVPRVAGGAWRLESGGTFTCLMPSAKCLLITSPGNYPSGWKLLKTINFLDGKSAFEILENIN